MSFYIIETEYEEGVVKMNETNTERLQNMSPIGIGQDGNLLVKQEDWFWLQEQAEKTEEKHNGFMASMEESVELAEKNERLREALQRMVNINGYFMGRMEEFNPLGMVLGFTWDQIETAYYEKNKINHTRQANGY